MKTTFFISILFSLTSTIEMSAQSKPEDRTIAENHFDVLCAALCYAMEYNDVAEVNQFIHPEIGLYYMHKVGLYDSFTHYDSISDKTRLSGYYRISGNSMDYTIKHEDFPKCNWEEERWEGHGIFVDTTQSHTPLTSIIKYNHGMPDEELSEKQLNKINELKPIESNSRKVLFTDNDILFYVTLIDGFWYLTIIDAATNDMGA